MCVFVFLGEFEGAFTIFGGTFKRYFLIFMIFSMFATFGIFLVLRMLLKVRFPPTGPFLGGPLLLFGLELVLCEESFHLDGLTVDGDLLLFDRA